MEDVEQQNFKPPSFQRKANTPHMLTRRKKDIRLTDYGVTFDKYKSELEQGIMQGLRPHFGYPILRFNSIKEGLSALNYEDAQGHPDPNMSLVNQDSI